MESRFNKVKFYIFILFLIGLGVGGYFFMNYMITSEETIFDSPIKNEEKKDLRIDSSKAYVYFTEINRVIDYLEVDTKYINFNLNGFEEIQNKLNNKMDEYKKSVVYSKNVEYDKDKVTEENDEGIYSLNYRDYYEYDYEDYISIIAKDFAYNIIDMEDAINLECVVFNKVTGEKIMEDELLKKYDTSLDKIKTNVTTKLNALQEKDENGNDIININKTMEEFNYVLYINKLGKLEICYKVIQNTTAYFDVLVLE